MKILHIIDHLGSGGAQSIVQGIFNNNPSANYFLYSLRKKEHTVSIKNKNVIINKNNSSYSIAPIWCLKKIVQEKKITILHCHLFRSQIFGWFLKIIWFPNITLLFHEHGRIYTNNFLYTIFLQLAKKQVNKFIAVSHSAKNVLIKKIKIHPSKIILLSNYVDLSRFNILEDSLDTPHTDHIFSIGFAGRLAAVKGCEYMIKALPNLQIKFKAYIAGDGPLKNQLIHLAKKLQIDDKIEFMGFVSDIKKFYQMIDILIVPSLHESFGISVIEAQAMKVPVIASNVSALNEIISDNKTGLLFNLQDPKDLAEKINYLFNNPQLKKQIIDNAFSKVHKYSFDLYIKKLNQIYENTK